MISMYVLHDGGLFEYYKGSQSVVITVSTSNLFEKFNAWHSEFHGNRLSGKRGIYCNTGAMFRKEGKIWFTILYFHATEPSFQLNLHFFLILTGNCLDYEKNVSNKKLCLLSPSLHSVQVCHWISC